MKITNLLTTTIAAGLLMTLSAKAQVITSIQFADGNPLAPTDVAGLDSQANWNVVNLTGNQIYYNTPQEAFTQSASSGLVTSTGSASSVGYSVTDGGGVGYAGTGQTGADGTLFNNGAATYGYNNQTTLGSGGQPASNLYGDPVTLTLTGLNPSDSYTVLAYITGSAYDLSEASLSSTVGGTQYFTTADGGYAAATFTTYGSNTSSTDIGAADPTNPGAAAGFQSNYVEFSDITGVTSDTLTLTQLGSYPYGTFTPAGSPAAYNNSFGNSIIGLSGVQVLDTPVVAPEPSTWALMFGGVAALFVISRRRTSKV